MVEEKTVAKWLHSDRCLARHVSDPDLRVEAVTSGAASRRWSSDQCALIAAEENGDEEQNRDWCSVEWENKVVFAQDLRRERQDNHRSVDEVD